ncbi:MAG: dimethylargininase [Actinomycetota bacterium]|nr:dimethylargininase [Actinomycetota bacterium]
MPVAITRGVSPAIAACELTLLERMPIDLDVARDQHADYEAALVRLGCRVERLQAEPDLPDSVFVEDVAVVLDEVAVLTRPGAESRRGERPSIERALSPYRDVVAIEAPGAVDGGDVLVSGRDVWIGLTTRSNRHAIDQFRRAVTDHGYRVHPIEVTGCLHLKSSAPAAGDGLLVANPDWVDVDQFTDHRCVAVDPSEPGAANVVRIGDSVLAAAAFPLTAERLADAGLDVHLVDASELAKAEGALTCCSLIFDEDPE